MLERWKNIFSDIMKFIPLSPNFIKILPQFCKLLDYLRVESWYGPYKIGVLFKHSGKITHPDIKHVLGYHLEFQGCAPH